jgi:hypothetical protein
MPGTGTGRTRQALTKTGPRNSPKSSILSSKIGSLSGSEELKEILSGQETQLQQVPCRPCCQENLCLAKMDVMKTNSLTGRMPVNIWILENGGG